VKDLPTGQIPLFFIFLLGMGTRNNILISAAGILLIMHAMGLERFFPILENRAIDLGLLFLTLAILVPFATGKIALQQIISFLCSPAGFIAGIGGAIAAILNARGVNLLTTEPDVIGAIILGALISIAFWGGIPVGPVMAAGIASVLLQVFRSFF
jgi:uncharacterized membrane protein (DUF441 family)